MKYLFQISNIKLKTNLIGVERDLRDKNPKNLLFVFFSVFCFILFV